MLLLGLIDVPTWLLLTICLLVLIYCYITKDLNHFKSQGVPGPKPYPLIGSGYGLYIHGIRDSIMKEREKYGKIYGAFLFGAKHLVVSDPEVLNRVLVKDFDKFTDRNTFDFPDKVQKHIITRLRGEEWKRVRNLLTPTFTTGKLKAMFGHIKHCCNQLMEHVEEKAEKNEMFDVSGQQNYPMEVKEVCGAFTMDTIARTAFGFELNAQKDKDNVFIRMANKALSPNKFVVAMFMLFMPVLKVFNKMNISVLPTATLEFFSDIVEKIISNRKAGEKMQSDFVQLMLNAHEDEIDTKAVKDEVAEGGAVFDEVMASKRKGLTKDEILAQGVFFFLAGYETSASSLTYLLYCLALNGEWQDKVYAEVVDALGEKDEFDYNVISKLTYLEMCLSESLRLYPATPMLTRAITKVYAEVVDALGEKDEFDYNVISKLTYLEMCLSESLRLYPATPMLTRAITKACVVGGVHMPAKSAVMIPVQAIHYDPEIYPEPERFKPERFSAEEKANRPPQLWLPFGYGPRNCIGMRLAQLNIKIAAAHLILKYRLLPCEKTAVPLKFNKMGHLDPAVGCWLKLESRM